MTHEHTDGWTVESRAVFKGAESAKRSRQKPLIIKNLDHKDLNHAFNFKDDLFLFLRIHHIPSLMFLIWANFFKNITKINIDHDKIAVGDRMQT